MVNQELVLGRIFCLSIPCSLNVEIIVKSIFEISSRTDSISGNLFLVEQWIISNTAEHSKADPLEMTKIFLRSALLYLLLFSAMFRIMLIAAFRSWSFRFRSRSFIRRTFVSNSVYKNNAFWYTISCLNSTGQSSIAY